MNGLEPDPRVPRIGYSGSERPPTVEQQRDGPVIDQFNIHVCSKDALGNRNAGHGDPIDEPTIKPLGLGLLGGLDEARPATLPAIAQERELTDGQDRAAGLKYIAIHLPLLIHECAEPDDLLGQTVGVLNLIAPGDAEQDEPAQIDPADDRTIDCYRCLRDPLQDGAHPIGNPQPATADSATSARVL